MSFETLKSAADKLVLEKKFMNAIKNYDTLISNQEFSKEEKLKNVFFNKGYCLYSLKKFEKAIEMFFKALELDPEYIKAYYYKGLSLLELQMYDDAIEVFKIGMIKNPKDEKIFNEKIQHVLMKKLEF